MLFRSRGTWHGTGKPFTEFDFAYIGSGEGAQVYGWGTYIAQLRSTASHYQKQEESKALAAWAKSPQMKAWKAANEITWDGKNADEWQKLALSWDNASDLGLEKDMAAIEKQLGGLSSDQAESISSVLRDATEDMASSLAQGLYNIANPKTSVEYVTRRLTDDAKKELAPLLSNLDKLGGPSTEILYNGQRDRKSTRLNSSHT